MGENTKTAFLAIYRREILSRYAWAQDAEKLSRFMASVFHTISGPVATWNHQGEAVTAAWRAMGNKGKPTLKALRALA
jgi:hypothetical protein